MLVVGDINWLQILIAFAGGSLVATLVKIGWDLFRDRIPRIQKRIEVDRIFSATQNDSALQANVTVLNDGTNNTFNNLSLARITISNRSRMNHEVFDLGVTLPDGHEIILLDYQSQDRHHTVFVAQQPSPSAPFRTLDVTCKPLNRLEEYTLKVYVHSIDKPVAIDDVKLSTTAPVKWSTAPAIDEPLRFHHFVNAALITTSAGIAFGAVGTMFLTSSLRTQSARYNRAIEEVISSRDSLESKVREMEQSVAELTEASRGGRTAGRVPTTD